MIEPDDMGEHTVFTRGIMVRPRDKRGQNNKGTQALITNGSVVHVYPNQFMMLVDGGKVVDYTAEEGYYQVENTGAPSLFNGQFGDALEESFRRIQYGGVPSGTQKVYFINLQEIKGIRFGTRTPINYFDQAYNAAVSYTHLDVYKRQHLYTAKLFLEFLKSFRNLSMEDQTEAIILFDRLVRILSRRKAGE